MAGNGAAAAAPTAPAAGQLEAHEDKRPRLDAAQAAAPAAAAAPASSLAVSLRPFAVVDEVAEGSPAAAAGIQLGDQLCRWVGVCCLLLPTGS